MTSERNGRRLNVVILQKYKSSDREVKLNFRGFVWRIRATEINLSTSEVSNRISQLHPHNRVELHLILHFNSFGASAFFICCKHFDERGVNEGEGSGEIPLKMEKESFPPQVRASRYPGCHREMKKDMKSNKHLYIQST